MTEASHLVQIRDPGHDRGQLPVIVRISDPGQDRGQLPAVVQISEPGHDRGQLPAQRPATCIHTNK